MVTVGTAVASRPPYRSRRALLTHRAPPSGFGVEAVTRQRVYRSDWRKEARDERDEPLPAEACRLAAPLERCAPDRFTLLKNHHRLGWLSHEYRTLRCYFGMSVWCRKRSFVVTI